MSTILFWLAENFSITSNTTPDSTSNGLLGLIGSNATSIPYLSIKLFYVYGINFNLLAFEIKPSDSYWSDTLKKVKPGVDKNVEICYWVMVSVLQIFGILQMKTEYQYCGSMYCMTLIKHWSNISHPKYGSFVDCLTLLLTRN